MRGSTQSLLMLSGLGLAMLVIGCGKPEAKKPAPSAPPSPAASQPPAQASQPAGEKQAGAGKEKLPEGLAELPEADRALAEKQKVCPVTGEALGSMGKPLKVTVKGRTVFLCCGGCEEDLKKDPDKFLAKLDAAVEKK